MPAKPKQNERLQAFRGQYGRLCVLVAQALGEHHPEPRVIEAAMGLGTDRASVYVALRHQATRTYDALRRCHLARIPDEDTVAAAYEARTATSQEWAIVLPAFSDKTVQGV